MESKFYKNQIDYSELPEDALILDVRNGSEHAEIALRRRHYFVELPNFDAADFIKRYGLNGERVYVLCKSGMVRTLFLVFGVLTTIPVLGV